MQQEALNKTFQKLEELDLPLITVTYFVADEKKTGGVCVKYFFNDNEKVTDAADSTKTSIYDFIQKNVSTAIVVDCENSDVYKLFAMLKNLNQEELSKIKKLSSMMITTLQPAGTGLKSSPLFLWNILRLNELWTTNA